MQHLKPDWKNFLFYLLTIAGAFIILALFFSREPNQNPTNNQSMNSPTVAPGKYKSPPQISIDQDKNYSALVQTSLGDFTISFFPKEVPNTVNNFIFLARDNFYNGVIFHRIIKGFMVQSGDPNGDGTGGPGFKFADEKITRDYKRGIVAMANSGPDTNGSQFFIMHADNDLPKNYVIFGEVTKGLETIDKTASVEVEDNGQGENSKPKTKVTIEKITISEK